MGTDALVGKLGFPSVRSEVGKEQPNPQTLQLPLSLRARALEPVTPGCVHMGNAHSRGHFTGFP